MKTENYKIEGLHCANCAARTEKVLKAVPGVKNAVCNFALAEAQITFNPQISAPQDLATAVEEAGFHLVLEERTKDEEAELQQSTYLHARRDMRLALLLAIAVIAMQRYTSPFTIWGYIAWALATVTILFPGRSFFVNAWKQALRSSANMDTLVACSTGISYIVSVITLLFPHWNTLSHQLYFNSTCGIIAFILIGRLLESKAKADTASALKALMGLRPTTTLRAYLDPESGKEKLETLLIRNAQEGDILVVRPGEKIPLDGTIYNGHSSIDESMLSGESTPIEKSKDDTVYEGTINGKGILYIKVVKTAKHTLLAQIIQTVHDAQNSKAPIQHQVDKVAAIFVPFVFACAIIAASLWYFIDGNSQQALLSAITILVVACPCALGLATPTAIMVGIGRGAQKGILIRDATSLEHAKNIDTIVFDKTGTLTEGKPRIDKEYWDKDYSQEEQQTIAAAILSIESHSEHPLAEALAHHFHHNATLHVSQIENIPGQGITAFADGHHWHIGNERLLSNNDTPISLPSDFPLTATPVYVARDKKCIATFAITDPIKPEAAKAIQSIHNMGIETHILSGDSQQVVESVSRELGIQHAKGGVLPQDKAEYICQLQKQGHSVAMIGDGINDSSALAYADFSVAMGRGTDVAMSVAQTTLQRSDLNILPFALRLSKRTHRIIKENLFWAFIYNFTLIPIAGGMLIPICGMTMPPTLAAAAMAFSSVSVVTNSLRLKRTK